MPEFWLDADSLIIPHRTAFRFSIAIQFWEFLEQKADENIIASPAIVLDKELDGNGDLLEKWAKQQSGKLFIQPTIQVQEMFRKVADNVQNNNRYAAHQVTKFLDGADPWLIAYAKVFGGRIVTFEKREPNSTIPKIPDVAKVFDIVCTNLWDMLDELQFSFGK